MSESIYDALTEDKKELMLKHQDLLYDMLDVAIEELLEIADEHEIYMIDDMKCCKDYQSIFDYLKHQALKRK